MSDETKPAENNGEQQEQGQTFTQADVDRIVADRLKREREATKAKYADHDQLKEKASQATTLEERLAALEGELTTTRVSALRATVASRFGVSTEPGPDGGPSDADLFLTGTDEETLTAQAKRLAGRESDRKKQGNFVPSEGNNPRPAEDEMRTFARNLFTSRD